MSLTCSWSLTDFLLFPKIQLRSVSLREDRSFPKQKENKKHYHCGTSQQLHKVKQKLTMNTTKVHHWCTSYIVQLFNLILISAVESIGACVRVEGDGKRLPSKEEDEEVCGVLLLAAGIKRQRIIN